MNPFDEMDGIMRAYVILLRQANLEKRVMESALRKIANGAKDPYRIVMETMITIGMLREKYETPEMGLAVNFAERRDAADSLRDVRVRAVPGAVDGGVAAVPGGEVRDVEVSEWTRPYKTNDF